MLSKIYSAGVVGIDGYEVTVECSAWNRLPKFELVGLADTAIKEAKDRVQSASENSGIKFPSLDIMINLAPADVKKMGSALDLAILLAIYQADGIIPYDYDFSDKCVIGELSLSGNFRAIRGVLSMALSAKERGKKEIFVPAENAKEASVVSGITAYPVRNIIELIDHLNGKSLFLPLNLIKRYLNANRK
jgi:magnesium chelatase family protein